MADKPKPTPETPETPEMLEPVVYISDFSQLRIAYRDGYLVFVAGRYQTSDADEIAWLDQCDSCTRVTR